MWNGSVGVSPYNKPTHQEGFSLLEILVAFVITGLVVGGILQMFGSSIRAVSLSEEYSYAAQLAESKMMLVGSEVLVESGSHSGSDDKYDWSINIQSTEFQFPEEAPPPNIFPYEVIVDVRWEGGKGMRSYQLVSMRFGEEP
jgi:general secretion pathway protein I